MIRRPASNAEDVADRLPRDAGVTCGVDPVVQNVLRSGDGTDVPF